MKQGTPLRWCEHHQAWEVYDLTLALSRFEAERICNYALSKFSDKVRGMRPGPERERRVANLQKLTPQLLRQVFKGGAGDRVLFDLPIPQEAKAIFVDLGHGAFR